MSFFEIFNPGERHMRDEQDRQKMLVSKPTHGGGAPLGIDLDGGIATITIRTASGPEDNEAPAAENPPEEGASAEHPDREPEQTAADSPDEEGTSS